MLIVETYCMAYSYVACRLTILTPVHSESAFKEEELQSFGTPSFIC